MADVNDPAVAMVDRDEGLRLRVYDDATGQTIVPGYTVVGNPTIGHGRNLIGEGITITEAAYLRDNDLASVCAGLSKYAWYLALDVVRRAVVEDLVVNLGLMGFLAFHDTILALSLKRWNDAATALLESDAAKALPERYGRLAQMLRTGVLI